MPSFTYSARDLADTDRLGAALAASLPEGAVVGLSGPLGAGKTRLVQALAEACGADRAAVTSPTFVLVHEYPGRPPIYHFDAYRIADRDEWQELGAEEYFHRGGIVLVEWADRVEAELPPERLDVKIEVTGEGSRQFELVGRGETYEDVIEIARGRLGSR